MSMLCSVTLYHTQKGTLQANYYSCGAYGVPIANTLGGPAPLGCVKGDYSADVQGLYENLAVNEIDHVAYIQAALGEQSFQLATYVEDLKLCMHHASCCEQTVLSL